MLHSRALSKVPPRPADNPAESKAALEALDSKHGPAADAGADTADAAAAASAPPLAGLDPVELIPQFVVADVNLDEATGAVVPPVSGAVPTADGSGGAVWAVSGGGSVTLGVAAGATGTTLIPGAPQSGPALTLRSIAAATPNTTLAVVGEDLQVGVNPVLTGITSISNGSGGSGRTIDLSVANVIGLNAREVNWPNQPWVEMYSTPSTGLLAPTGAATDTVLNFTAMNSPVGYQNLFTVSSNGTMTFDAMGPCRVKFNVTSTISLVGGGGASNLYFYLSKNGATGFNPATGPPSSSGGGYAGVIFVTTGANAISSFAFTTSIVMNSTDTVSIACYNSSALTQAPVLTSTCVFGEGMLVAL